jgi:hypothetical protein
MMVNRYLNPLYRESWISDRGGYSYPFVCRCFSGCCVAARPETPSMEKQEAK